ncbi:MAG TPA: hypothetical protein VH107_11205 [Lacipirellulaceae bacterium]|nr:hypothetical protein [Lacipirellulaceae bacterium]
MNSPWLALRVAAVVFALVSLAQLVRLVTAAQVSVDGHLIPLWASGIALVIAGGLSAWTGQLSYRSAK